MSSVAVNDITIGFYPDGGDAGGTRSMLSDLNAALAASWPSTASCGAPMINVVGWYAQTYPAETFTGFQLMPLVHDIKREYQRCDRSTQFVYEASVMPFQTWTGYTADNNVKAREVADVMKTMLDTSRLDDGCFSIAEIRLRFGHEMNYYIKSGLYPPSTHPADPGLDFRTAFDQVALAVRALPSEYSQSIKMFWCPNIASTSTHALAEYETFLPTLSYVDYIGIDYYCPAAGCLDAADFVRKMKTLHDKYACASRPFVLGETGLHFDDNDGGGIAAKLAWLHVVTGSHVRKALPHLVGVSWFNYEKDRDYRLLCVQHEQSSQNTPFVEWAASKVEKNHAVQAVQAEGKAGGKVKKFWKTLVSS